MLTHQDIKIIENIVITQVSSIVKSTKEELIKEMHRQTSILADQTMEYVRAVEGVYDQKFKDHEVRIVNLEEQ